MGLKMTAAEFARLMDQQDVPARNGRQRKVKRVKFHHQPKLRPAHFLLMVTALVVGLIYGEAGRAMAIVWIIMAYDLHQIRAGMETFYRWQDAREEDDADG